MSDTHNPWRPRPPLRRPRRSLLALALALLLGGCGGGEVAGVGSGGTGTYSSGRITGFGSIVVNGVHYDETAASITDSEGTPIARSALRVGMIVQVDAPSVTLQPGQTSVAAEQVVVRSDLLGPVDLVTGDTLVVMGQTVRVDAGTRFGDELPGGLDDLDAGDTVEVFGWQDASDGHFKATLVLKRTGVPSYKVRGVVRDLDPRTGTCRIGQQTIHYTWSGTPPSLAEGAVAEALLYTSPAGSGWNALAIGPSGALAANRGAVQVQGLVTRTSINRKAFSVDGVPVDATRIACPSCAGLSVGSGVSVKGYLSEGTLVAAEVAVTP